jgi:hypothetical protein
LAHTYGINFYQYTLLFKKKLNLVQLYEYDYAVLRSYYAGHAARRRVQVPTSMMHPVAIGLMTDAMSFKMICFKIDHV